MPSLIVDSSGRPFGDVPAGGRARADNSPSPGAILPPYSSLFPYEASNIQTTEMGDWLPYIRSPDSEINQFRDRMVARSRDLSRNDGWANGGITRILDNTVGAHLRLSANPDWRALARFSKKFDATWANEMRQAIESLWRGYSEDLGRYNDVSRQLTISQQMRLALRHKLIDGEALFVSYWKPERVGRGGAQYATAFQVVDPDRLSNPYLAVDTRYMRGGVEIDDDGVPLAYHIRKAQPYDTYNTVESMEWEHVEREDEDGWRRVIHDYERDRAGQHRGIGIFTPVLSHAKMLARYYGVELQAATVATIFGTYVTSPYDPAMIEAAMDSEGEELGYYQEIRTDWAKDRPAMLNNVRVPTLAPGEEIKQVAAAHPHSGFQDFAHEMLRSIAAALGVSAEQITQDWSKTNYSSARAALLESWKTLSRRSAEFKMGSATPLYATWLQEVIERGDLDDVLPSDAPDFVEAPTAYARCDWLGVARGWVDPVKEKQGAVLGMDAGLSTLKRECAEQGLDWEEVIAQRAVELAAFKRLGIAPPSWAGIETAADAALLKKNLNLNEKSPVLAQRLFNTPLAITPAKAEMVMAALADRFGITKLFRASGESFAMSEFGFEEEESEPDYRYYDVVAGVAIIPITGTLVQKSGYMRPTCGMTGYDGIRANLSTALEDPAVRAIMLDIDSGGGEVAGCFDLVDAIYGARGTKPIWAVLSESAYSAAYAIASAADRITVPRTGGTGSVGVICAHVDFSKALAKDGVTVTMIHYGDRKADGNEFNPLSDEALGRFQADVNAMGELFVKTVARNRKLSAATVRGTQAGTFLGADGVEIGFADAVMAPDEAFRSLLAELG